MQFRSPIGYVAVAGVVGLMLGVYVLPSLPFLSQDEAQINTDAPPLVYHHRSPHPQSLTMAHIPSRPATQQPGKTAPDFSLPDQNGVIHSLAETKGKWVVLAFYPMDESSACTLQNKTYTAQKDQFAPLHAVVYTVSCQDVASKRDFALHASLSHTLLADVGGKVAAAYGVLMGSSGFANRVTFYIRPDRRIAAVDDNIHLFTAAQDSLATLQQLQSTQIK